MKKNKIIPPPLKNNVIILIMDFFFPENLQLHFFPQNHAALISMVLNVTHFCVNICDPAAQKQS